MQWEAMEGVYSGEGKTPSQHCPARLRLRCAAASPPCSPPAWLTNSSARGAKSRRGKAPSSPTNPRHRAEPLQGGKQEISPEL